MLRDNNYEQLAIKSEDFPLIAHQGSYDHIRDVQMYVGAFSVP